MMRRDKDEQRQLWLVRINEMADSGLTQQEWCSKKKIPLSTLRYWLRRLKKQAAEASAEDTRWLRLDLVAPQVSTTSSSEDTDINSSTINIKYADFTVELKDSFAPQRVFDILRILKSL